MTRPARPTRPPARRAFALLMVVMLSVIAGISVMLMIERQASHGLASARLQRSYQWTHDSAGIQELVTDWLKLANAKPENAVDPDRLAFTIPLSGEYDEVRVYVTEAQGQIRSNVEMLGGREAVLTGEVLDRLRDLYGTLPRDLTRTRGPVPMSIKTIPEDLLRVVAQVVLPEGPNQELCDALLSARQQGTLTDATWRDMQNELELESPQIAFVNIMLTTEPTLYWVEAAWIRDGVAVRRAGGEMLIKPEEAGLWERSSPFLSWSALEVDEETERLGLTRYPPDPATGY